MLESVQESIAGMIKTDGKKNFANLTDKQKTFIKELIAFGKKPRKIATLIENDKGRPMQAPENSLHFLKTQLTSQNVDDLFNEIQSAGFSKIVGLLAHFCYWCVFANFNEYPLDDYHMKQLFISMQ